MVGVMLPSSITRSLMVSCGMLIRNATFIANILMEMQRNANLPQCTYLFSNCSVTASLSSAFSVVFSVAFLSIFLLYAYVIISPLYLCSSSIFALFRHQNITNEYNILYIILHIVSKSLCMN